MTLVSAIPVPATVDGLPLHPLVVHVVVVLIPLSVVGAIGISLWPAMRRHFGLLVLGCALVALVFVPVATSSGKKFRDRLGAQQLVRQHQHYAEQLFPWAATLVVLLLLAMTVDIARRLGPVLEAAPPEPGRPSGGGVSGGGVAVAVRTQAAAIAPAVTGLDRTVGRLIPARLREATGLQRAAQPVLSVLTIAVALVLVWYCYKTGESGAKAVWGGR